MIFIAIIEYAILASTFTIAKVAIRFSDPLFLIGVRMIGAAPIMFLVHTWQNNYSARINKKDFILFLKTSLFHIFLPFIGEFWALQYVSSAKTALTYSLTPFIAALLSYFLRKKKFSMRQIFGLIVGLLGILPLLISTDQVVGEFFAVSLPELALLLSVISASYAWFLVADLMEKGYGISLINGVAMFFGGLLALVLWYFLPGESYPIKGDIHQFLFWTFLLILVANVLSYNLYGWLLKHLSITFMSALGFLCPIFASIYGAMLLKENLTLSHFLALMMVSLGLALFYRDEIKRSKANAAS